MERTKQKDLETLCNILNRITSSPMEQHSRINGRVISNVDNFHLSWQSGGVALHRTSATSGDITCPLGSELISKKDLFTKMEAFIKGVQYAKN